MVLDQGVISFEGVWKNYGETTALRDVSFAVNRGEVALLTGHSGAGKSTLLRVLYGAERADRGKAVVAGFDLGKLRRSTVPQLRRTVGVVFQDFKLLLDRTVRENVGIALEIRNVPKKEIRLRVDASLAAVGLLGRGDVVTQHLSGGEQQRVAIARAVVGEPEVLLADEPSGNLDPERSRELLNLFETLRLRGATMIIATHDPEVVKFALAHEWRRIRLSEGSVVDVPDDSISKPNPAARRGSLVQLEAAMLRRLLEAK